MLNINETTVQITITDKIIDVNGEVYNLKTLIIPSDLPSGVTQILWYPHIRCYFIDGKKTDLECTQENWDKWVQPFVDQWQVAKDEHDQAIEEENSFPVRQAKALTQLNEDFAIVSDRAHLVSSLGFTADANRIAKDNVQGLIEEVGEGTISFCDYYNQFHTLNKTQLETLKSEINQNGQNLYQQKWVYRTAIEQCTDNEGLDQVVTAINFTYMDFTPQAEEPTGDGEQAAETDQSAEQTE